MCNDPAWLTLKKKDFLWTDSLTLNIVALIRPTASNIAYLLFRLSLDLISPHLWGKNKLKCWQWLFFFPSAVVYRWQISEAALLLAGMTSTLIQCQSLQGCINQWTLSQNHINGSYLQLASRVIIQYSCLSPRLSLEDLYSAVLVKTREWQTQTFPPIELNPNRNLLKHSNYKILLILFGRRVSYRE